MCILFLGGVEMWISLRVVSGTEYEVRMDSGDPECRGGYPMPKAILKRCVFRVKSQPKPRLAIKNLESIKT